MTTKHTAGPWAIGARDPADNTLPVIAEGRCNTIAEVRPRPFYDDTQEATARLIAAAPDLLAALETIEAQLHATLSAASDAGRPNHIYSGPIEAQLLYARAAIARALGQ